MRPIKSITDTDGSIIDIFEDGVVTRTENPDDPMTMTCCEYPWNMAQYFYETYITKSTKVRSAV